jgi:hypothetical protein
MAKGPGYAKGGSASFSSEKAKKPAVAPVKNKSAVKGVSNKSK